MKKKLRRCTLLCCALLLLLCACAPGGQPEKPAPPDAPDAPKTPDVPKTPDAPGVPEQAEPVYFLVHDVFVGSLENGEWKSVAEAALDYAKGESFVVGELFGCATYVWYLQTGEMGRAERFFAYTGDGPSGFDVSRSEQFAPYAIETDGQGDDWFAVPTELGPEVYDVPVPDCGYALVMEPEGECVFAASDGRDMRPKSVEWAGEGFDAAASQQSADAVQRFLKKAGISSDAAVQTAVLDYDGDGQRETFVFASTPRDADGYQMVSEENGGTFSLVLLLDGDREETVYSKTAPYTDDMTAMFVQRPAGLFDLDGDGVFELCMTEGYWEGSYHFVLREQNGGWEIVLAGASGM